MHSLLKKILWVILAFSLVCCEKEQMATGNIPWHFNKSKPPVARAGNDTAIVFPKDYIVLDGSASSDPEGSLLAYSWSKVRGPSDVSFSNHRGVKTEVNSLKEGIYHFVLTVTDEHKLTGKDTVAVTVNRVTCESRPFIYARLIPVGKFPRARSNMLCATANNKILFAGGANDEDRVDIYDINTGTWTLAGLSREWFGRRYGMAVASVGNKVLFAGGGEPIGGDGSALVDIYDAVTNTWTIAFLSQGRSGLAAVTWNDKVFFAGGGHISDKDPYPWINSRVVDIYDESSNTWTTSSLSEGRSGLQGFSAGDKIYFSGGIVYPGVSGRVDIYDAINNSWSTDEMKIKRFNFTTLFADNKIFWAGGNDWSGWTNNVEIRDLDSGISKIECLSPRVQPKSAIKDDNIIFFTSSFAEDITVDDQFDIYNITTGTWFIGLLPDQLVGAAVISVNNHIYVAGGWLNKVLSDQLWKLEF